MPSRWTPTGVRRQACSLRRMCKQSFQRGYRSVKVHCTTVKCSSVSTRHRCALISGTAPPNLPLSTTCYTCTHLAAHRIHTTSHLRAAGSLPSSIPSAPLPVSSVFYQPLLPFGVLHAPLVPYLPPFWRQARLLVQRQQATTTFSRPLIAVMHFAHVGCMCTPCTLPLRQHSHRQQGTGAVKAWTGTKRDR